MIRRCRKSKENMTKFMQTCVPHLFSLIIVVASLLFDLLYMRFGSKDLPPGAQNLMAMEFLLIPPIINPLIYGLKLTKIRYSIQNVMCNEISRVGLQKIHFGF